ncbi:UNVERIFIED_CONTAM: mediator complex subunit MED21 [Hammondia hammondi]|eukprot:XP_008886333.1 mediator complex subunit MED21 [Hammondia hammondi]
MLPALASPPFPSPQAADPVTRLQQLLTNFSRHLYEVVQQIPELALPLPLSPTDSSSSSYSASSSSSSSVSGDAEKRSQMEMFLLRSANNVAVIMHAIETEMVNLPSSLRTREETQRRLAFLEKENERAAEELQAVAAEAARVREALRQLLPFSVARAASAPSSSFFVVLTFLSLLVLSSFTSFFDFASFCLSSFFAF